VNPIIISTEVYERYTAKYGDNLQGCCLLIAGEIADRVGGDVVAGELTWYGGSCRRTHWWAAKGDVVLDPMGDYLLLFEAAPGREEHHRDRTLFEQLLPEYERWRVKPATAEPEPAPQD